MLGSTLTPHDSYRKIELDARVEGSDGIALTRLCLDRAMDELSRAYECDGPDRRAGRSKALQGASSAVLALQSGIDAANPIGAVLDEFYRGIYAGIGQLSKTWDHGLAMQLRKDLEDIATIAG